MERKRAEDFDPELLDLYDGFAHGRIDRREFLDRAARFAGGGVTAAALLAALSPDYALANQVEEADPRIGATFVDVPSPRGHGTVRGYLVRPARARRAPGVVVVHENRGLNPYVKDVARRLAAAGFTALAPDGLTSLGGYPGTDEEGKALQRTLDKEALLQDFIAAFEQLRADPQVTGRVGVVGFCFGGWVSNMMAVRLPHLAAAVPFYGRQPPGTEVHRIRAPLLIHLAENDPRVNAGWPDYREALQGLGIGYTAHMYRGVNHGFHNDTTPRFDPEAAALAWERTVTFFREHLS
jgi:carboxymethylenebutenolidase